MVSAVRERGPATAAARRGRGFTLLEVLAAVAILAVWFILIAGTAMQGLRAEGISRRRLEAAMIADQAMAELRQQVADLSLTIADKVLGEALDHTTQRRLIAEFIDETEELT